MAASKHDDFKRRREENAISTLNRILIVALLLAFLVVVFILFMPELKKQQQLRAEIKELSDEIQEQRQFVHLQRKEFDWLTQHPEYVEIIARDRLDLMKEGEVIFRIDPGAAEPILRRAPAFDPQPVQP